MGIRTCLPALLVFCLLLALTGCQEGPVAVELQIDPALDTNLEVPLTLSANSVLQSDTLHASITGTYESFKWSLDGNSLSGQTTASLDIDLAALTVGRHVLTAWALPDNTWYSGSASFSVHL